MHGRKRGEEKNNQSGLKEYMWGDDEAIPITTMQQTN